MLMLMNQSQCWRTGGQVDFQIEPWRLVVGNKHPSLISSDIHTLDLYSKIPPYTHIFHQLERHWGWSMRFHIYTEVTHPLVSTLFNQLYIDNKWSCPKFYWFFCRREKRRIKKDIWKWRKEVIHSLYIGFLLISDFTCPGLLYLLSFHLYYGQQKLLFFSILVRVSKVSFCKSNFSGLVEKGLSFISQSNASFPSWVAHSLSSQT